MDDLNRQASTEKTDEIEITPEMIEAGENRFLELSGEFPTDYVVKEIYEAMEKARALEVA